MILKKKNYKLYIKDLGKLHLSYDLWREDHPKYNKNNLKIKRFLYFVPGKYEWTSIHKNTINKIKRKIINFKNISSV